MLIAAATPISFIEAMSNAVFIFLKDNNKERNTQIQTNFESRCKKSQNEKKKSKTFFVYALLKSEQPSRNKKPSVTVTKNTEEISFSKKEERKQDSLLLPSRRAKRQSFLVL